MANYIVLIFQLLFMCSMCWTLGMKYPELVKTKPKEILFWLSIIASIGLAIARLILAKGR